MADYPHVYVCVTEADRPDNEAMVRLADVVLLIRPSGGVDVWKVRTPMVIDVSVPERDWSYSLVPT